MPGVVTLAAAGSRYYSVPATTEYNGFAVTLYASSADIGTGDGSSEANAMDLVTALTLIGNGSTGKVLGVVPCVATTTSSDDDIVASWRATNNGTSGDPIIIVAKYQATDLANVGSNANRSELRVTGIADAPNPVFGDGGGDHVHWYGFYADESQSTASSGTGVMVAASGSVGTRFENCVVVGGSTSIANNHVGLYVNDATDLVVKNCHIRNYTNAAPGSNEGAIMMYGAKNFLVENCTINNVVSAFYIKGDVNGMNYGTVRYCYLTDYEFVRCQEINGTLGGVIFEQCIFENGTHSGVFLTNTGVNKKVTLNNCTIICTNSANGGLHSEQNVSEVNIARNIFSAVGSSKQLINLYNMTNTFESIGDDLYYSTVSWQMYKGSGTPITTLAGWISASGESDADEGDPGYLGGSGPEAYKRSSYADGRGAYITGNEIIGVS